MEDEYGPDTIFFTLKLKRTRTPAEVFEIMKKAIKKKGVTKKWSYIIDNDKMIVDFGDEKSESLCVSFDEKKVCHDFCKVYFPINGELFDNEKKSEFKALLNMIWSARKMFSQMEITDDYGQATDYMESKKYKISLRELTDEEHSYIQELFSSGITKHPDMIMTIIKQGLGMSDDEEWYEHINVKVDYNDDLLNKKESRMWPFWQTYIYETAAYKNERVMHNASRDLEFSGCWFSVAAFIFITDELYHYRDYVYRGDNRGFGVRHTQMRHFYNDKVYPLLDSMPDGFEKCCLAYRFFLSAYDFCGFKFVGKEEDLSGYRYVKVK